MDSADHIVTLKTTLGTLFIVLISDIISYTPIMEDIGNINDTLKAAGISEDTDTNKWTQLTP